MIPSYSPPVSLSGPLTDCAAPSEYFAQRSHRNSEKSALTSKNISSKLPAVESRTDPVEVIRGNHESMFDVFDSWTAIDNTQEGHDTWPSTETMLQNDERSIGHNSPGKGKDWTGSQRSTKGKRTAFITLAMPADHRTASVFSAGTRLPLTPVNFSISASFS